MRYLTWLISGILALTLFDSLAQTKSSLLKLQFRLASIDSLRRNDIQQFLNVNNSTPLGRDNSFLLKSVTNGHPSYLAALNAGAALTTGVTALQNESLGLNLEGEGITVGVWDDGLVKDHIELGNRVLTKQGTSFQTHATHVTGTILSAGISPTAKGMASKATGTTWYFDNDEAEMASLATSDQTGLLFSNHSYGVVVGWTKVNGAWTWTGDPTISTQEDYRHGFYGETAQLIDDIAYNAPYYTIAWAAGNDRIETGDGSHPADGNQGTGYDCIIPQSVAKNIITVGATNKITTYTDASSVVNTNFSSWGPTDDGRIKPDLVGAGVSVFSLSASGTNQYASLSGTSMATPNVTGSLVLIQELYSKLHGGQYMKAATLKALAIHTTKEAGSFPGPDYNFGWGLLDVQAAANVLLHQDESNSIIHEQRLDNGGTFQTTVSSQANQKMTATICWTDPPGKPVAPSLDPSNAMLVNDLDVRVVDEQGNIQLPWILNPNLPSTKATNGDNFRDNVEKIEFNAAGKKYTIKVTHKGTLVNNSQDFSIIVTCKSSINTPTNYYWIANSGNWNDGSHWALSSGGVAANSSPTANDNVIFDDNSFDDIAVRTITLPIDVSCKKLVVLTDRKAQLKLNNHKLTISKNLTFSASNFSFSSDGIVNFLGVGKNTINFQKGSASKTTMEFNGGSWLVSGNINVQKISLKKDTLKLSATKHSIKSIDGLSNTVLDIRGATIDSLEQSTIADLILLSSGAAVNIYTPAVLSWSSRYEGDLNVTGTTVQLMKNDTIKSLTLSNKAKLIMQGGTTHLISDLNISSSEGKEIELTSDGNAIINLLTHHKYCFDYLMLTNVDAAGNSILNAGVNSVVSNSSNWRQQECDKILYADFMNRFNCQNGYTSFEDMSTGAVVSWSWDFGDTESLTNTSVKENTYHTYVKPGTYDVTLTVSDGTSNHAYTKSVIIGEDDEQTNFVVSSGTSLMSFLQSDLYQWYKDDEPVVGANLRSYDYKGDIGRYVVVITTTDCNIASEPYLVTGIEQTDSQIQVSPNPAKEFIKISGLVYGSTIAITDAYGCEVYQIKADGPDSILNTKNFADGLYIVSIKSSQYKTQRKILITK